MGLACLFAGFASAEVADLEQVQAIDANVVYQYTFEGVADANSMEQKVSPFSPDLEIYSNTGGVYSVTFTNGFDGSTKVAHTMAGDKQSDGTRHHGAGLRSVGNITYPTSGTIEYLLKCSDINDSGHVISGGDTSPSNNLGRLIFLRNDSNLQSKAQMMVGGNSLIDVIGGDTGVGYNPNNWYYVAQTWTLSGTNIVLNAWVANLSAGIPPTQTVFSESRTFDGSLDTILYLGSREAGVTNGYYSNAELDALAIYDTVLDAATIESHVYTAFPGPYRQLDVGRLESSQAGHIDIAHQYTFAGDFVSSNGAGTWLEDKVGTAHLSQTLFESHRIADQLLGFDGQTPSAHFDAWESGAKGDGLQSVIKITYATSGTIEYMVQFGTTDNNNFMISGDGSGANDRLRFLSSDGTKAQMTMGSVSGHDLIGGTTGVGYTSGDWYYVAQTWSISAGSVTMNAWVANMNDTTPTLTKTIDGEINDFDGDMTTTLYLGSVTGGSDFMAGGLDAIAIYDAVLDPATFQSHLDDVLIGPARPATILSVSAVSGDVLRMVVDAPGAGHSYYPKSTPDLIIGTWAGVGHSTNGSDPFVVTNLDYVSEYDATGTNKVIYVQATNAAGFFGIGDE